MVHLRSAVAATRNVAETRGLFRLLSMDCFHPWPKLFSVRVVPNVQQHWSSCRCHLHVVRSDVRICAVVPTRRSQCSPVGSHTFRNLTCPASFTMPLQYFEQQLDPKLDSLGRKLLARLSNMPGLGRLSRAPMARNQARCLALVTRVGQHLNSLENAPKHATRATIGLKMDGASSATDRSEFITITKIAERVRTGFFSTALQFINQLVYFFRCLILFHQGNTTSLPRSCKGAVHFLEEVKTLLDTAHLTGDGDLNCSICLQNTNVPSNRLLTCDYCIKRFHQVPAWRAAAWDSCLRSCGDVVAPTGLLLSCRPLADRSNFHQGLDLRRVFRASYGSRVRCCIPGLVPWMRSDSVFGRLHPFSAIVQLHYGSARLLPCSYCHTDSANCGQQLEGGDRASGRRFSIQPIVRWRNECFRKMGAFGSLPLVALFGLVRHQEAAGTRLLQCSNESVSVARLMPRFAHSMRMPTSKTAGNDAAKSWINERTRFSTNAGNSYAHLRPPQQ